MMMLQLDNLNKMLQLHQQIEIFYVVDGIVAYFYDEDGQKMIAEAKADTIEEVLQQLENQLS